MDKVIITKNLKKDFLMGKIVVPALRGLSIEIKQGEFISIMGPSGSGKSTLLNLIGMLDMPTSGDVYINGQEVSGLSEKKRADFRLSNIGFIFQFFNLFLELSALENTMLPMLIQGVTKENCKNRARELLNLVELGDRMNHKPGELSGGEQQRVAIARSLINHPYLILADEPTGNLDTTTSRLIIDLLKRLSKKSNQTIILITHEMEIGREADRIIRLKDGNLSHMECS